jgi:hypothetical protein
MNVHSLCVEQPSSLGQNESSLKASATEDQNARDLGTLLIDSMAGFADTAPHDELGRLRRVEQSCLT